MQNENVISNVANTSSQVENPTEQNTETTIKRINPLLQRKSSAFSISVSSQDNLPITSEQAKEKPFNLENVKQVLKNLAENVNKNSENVSLYFAISGAEIESSTDYIVKITANTSINRGVLEKNKTLLVTTIKEKLSYNHLKIEIALQHIEEEKQIYNPMDKYFEIIEENPNIKQLKDFFSAEITY
ncbi:MAG: hypothetical protein IJ180_03145 [Bacteroidales bacterium]|nr:hypothetical protein [Bacteroidales bacterium]